MTVPTTPPAPVAPAARKCPICGKTAVPTHKPFCSKRCADIDLGRWFTESYTLPAPVTSPEDEEA